MTSENQENMPDIAPLDVSQVDPASFTDEESEYAYYLQHFATVANAVVMTGENRGFLDIKVWRRPQDNEPYNARVIENHASLCFFYTLDRPWNPYYGDPAVKIRLEAMLDFWCNMQHIDGRFSEYAYEQWSLAPTGFGIKFMGETLRRLHKSASSGGPTVDADVLDRAVAAAKKAIEVLLSHPDLLKHAENFSNQYTGFWGGTLSFLSAYPDEDMYRAFVEKIQIFREELTSPVGYHYERTGCDWRYTLATHTHNMRHMWHYARGTELESLIVEMEKPWVDWVSYNAVLEPDGSYFTVNRAIETRTEQPGFEYWNMPVVEHIPLAQAFAQDRDSQLDDARVAREKLIETWPSVAPLEMFAPHMFEGGRTDLTWRPTPDQQAEGRKLLPYLEKDRYTHFRMDDRVDVHYTFVRRPDYYATFNAGEIICPIQRYGIGLIWHPQMGSVLQTQSREAGPWGTQPADGELYEAATFQPKVSVGGTPFVPTSGQHDLGDGDVVFNYSLGDIGQKSVQFGESQVAVTVEHAGAFTEHVPLLIRAGDTLTVEGKEVRLKRADTTMVIVCDSDVHVEVQKTEVTHGPFELQRITIGASDNLHYRIAFE